MKTLEEVLKNIRYKSVDSCPCDNMFAALVQEQMPDYDIEIFDIDDDDPVAIANAIAATVKGQFVEDIQTQDWITENVDVCYYIVAYKLKEKTKEE